METKAKINHEPIDSVYTNLVDASFKPLSKELNNLKHF
jgi:hypothetical protein